MPTNKNAFIRYKYLDRLLSDHYHYYDIHDLTDKVNEMLCNDGFKKVGQRCVEKDNPIGEALYVSAGFRNLNDSQWGGHPMKHLAL
jgi:hypothetical protein